MAQFSSFFNQQQLTRQLITYGVVIVLPLTLNPGGLAQTTIEKQSLSQAVNATESSIIQKLTGTWEMQNSPVSLKVNLIFAPAGKLYLITHHGQRLEAYPVEYQINSTKKPMFLDVSSPGSQEKIKTIFELTNQGRLRLEFLGLNVGEPRPKGFTRNASLFKKISNRTTLPANVKIITSVDRQARSQQRDGETNVASLNRYQQAYYTEYGKFAKTFGELQISLKPESELYRYRIIPQNNQAVLHTATAKKPGLKSYAGFVFATKVKGEIKTYAIICQTNQPSMKPPVAPTIPKTVSQKSQCPVGSSLLP
ncbi:MAG TPA: type IV pilin-like G/H family protein [Nostocaceae cyanobacterium]|nr:type IV pilin-like G/H family protein [Nostocaceae cyanobacterium]